MIQFVLANGTTTVTPGVYGLITVDDSLINVAPTPSNVLLVGEALEGAPVQDLNLQGNFYTDFAELKSIHKSGPVVDAARQLFTNQPSVVFAGSVERVYVAKTNQSTSASKTIASPSGFGALASTRYGESGNMIKSQIVTAQSEVKPSSSYSWIPFPGASVEVVASGVSVGTYAFNVTTLASSAFPFLTTLASDLTGVGSVSGGFRAIVSGTPNVSLTAVGDQIVVVSSIAWAAAPAVNDVLVIPEASVLAGAADANVGAYRVTAATASSVTASKVLSTDATFASTVAYVAPVNVAAAAVTGSQTDWATADIVCLSPVVVSLTGASAAGQGLSLEVADETNLGSVALVRPAASGTILSAQAAAVGSISAAFASGVLTISVTGASWQNRPAVGSTLTIEASSPVAGATKANVGSWVVVSAGQSSVTLVSPAGLSGEAVASVGLAGNAAALKVQAPVVTNAYAAALAVSSSERKASVVAARVTDGESFPTTALGGQVALSVSYFASSATAATVEITAAGKLVVTPTQSPAVAPIVVPLGKYATLKDLVAYLTTIPGVFAKAEAAWASFSPLAVLDQVSPIGCLAATDVGALAARIKTDYHSWKQFFLDNPSIVSFVEGSLARKAGLPSAESSASFLTGGAVGATSNADIQAALDAGLKIPVRQVVPLFSRDASKDIEDALTEADSTYTIESVHAAAVGHVATASTPKAGRRRFCNLSFLGSFEDSLARVRAVSYERAQMAFQFVRALDGDGTLKRFLPWMSAAQIAAGRGQAALGTSMLRKNFAITEAVHLGDASLYSTSSILDFDPENQGQLEEAIGAGLLVFGQVPGQGLRLVSPDLSTQSKINSGKSWFFERVSIQYTLDQYYDAVKSVLENYIGERTSDVSAIVVSTAVDRVSSAFVQTGALLDFTPAKAISLGNGYSVQVQVKPTEAVEFISVDVQASRAVG